VDSVWLLAIHDVTSRAFWMFSKGYFRYSWKNVLLIYDVDAYWRVSGKQSCGLMTRTLVEMFKGNASIRYDVFDLSKNPQYNLKENLRREVSSQHTSKRCTFRYKYYCAVEPADLRWCRYWDVANDRIRFR